MPEKLAEPLPPEIDVLEADEDDGYENEEDQLQEEYIYDSEEAGNDLEEETAVPEDGADEEE